MERASLGTERDGAGPECPPSIPLTALPDHTTLRPQAPAVSGVSPRLAGPSLTWTLEGW